MSNFIRQKIREILQAEEYSEHNPIISIQLPGRTSRCIMQREDYIKLEDELFKLGSYGQVHNSKDPDKGRATL